MNYVSRRLRLNSELVVIAKVSEAEPIQEAKTGNAVDAFRGMRNTDHIVIRIQSDLRNLNVKAINGKPPRKCACKLYLDRWIPAAQQAIIFIQNEIKCCMLRTSSGISKQCASCLPSPSRQSENDLDSRSAVEQRPSCARH